MEEAAELSPFATVFRYPGEDDELLIDDAIGALNLAKKVYPEILVRFLREPFDQV